MSKFVQVRDINGYNSSGLSKGTLMYQTTLVAGASQSITLPKDFSEYNVIISPQAGATIWVAFGETATLPTGVFAQCAAELNPVSRKIAKGTVIQFITTDSSAEVGVRIDAI